MWTKFKPMKYGEWKQWFLLWRSMGPTERGCGPLKTPPPCRVERVLFPHPSGSTTKKQITFRSSGLPRYPGCLWSFYFLLVIKQNQSESQTFHDLFLLWTVANLFFFFFQVGNLSNDIQFQMCELGIFDVNSRKKWAIMLWTVESLPFLSCALWAKTREKGDGKENK